MTADEILALTPGEQLDQAIHTYVFGGSGPLMKYSTNDADGARIMDKLPLFVGRIEGGARYNPVRPWIAGVMSSDGAANAYVTRLTVAAPTRLIALSKAALLVIFQPAKSNQGAPRVTSEQAAKAIAARIGTPGARSPAAGAAAAQKAAEKRAADQLTREVKAAKKAAKLAGIPYVPRTATEVQDAARRPSAPQTVSQPAVFTGERSRRAPMPTRVKEFIPPQPIDTGGTPKTS